MRDHPVIVTLAVIFAGGALLALVIIPGYAPEPGFEAVNAGPARHPTTTAVPAELGDTLGGPAALEAALPLELAAAGAAYVAGLQRAELTAFLTAVEADRVEAERAAAEEAERAARPPAPAPRSSSAGGTVWDDLAQCENSGNWQAANGTYTGGLGFLYSTWHAYGGDDFAPAAHLATREQQIIVAERLLAYAGNFSPWPGCRAKLGLP